MQVALVHNCYGGALCYCMHGNKKGIQERLTKAKMSAENIEIHKNYDTGAYSGGKIEK